MIFSAVYAQAVDQKRILSDEASKPNRRRIPVKLTRALGIAAIAALSAIHVFADGLTQVQATDLNLGTATNYGVVFLGSGTLQVNSGPINGNVLAGQGETVTSSGRNNGGIGSYTYSYDNVSEANGLNGLQNPPANKALVSTFGLARSRTASKTYRHMRPACQQRSPSPRV